MTTTVRDVLAETLENRQLLSHPFYKRWEAGTLRDGELKAYAEQYRFFEQMLPEFLARLASELPASSARQRVLENLSDEVGPPSHLALFANFASSLGAEDVAISPAMSALVKTYDDVLERGGECGLAGLLAYESQGAAIATSKADGLLEHYNATYDDVTFWRVHGEIEEDHASWTLEALSTLDPTEESIRTGVGLVADAWWDFLDERETLAA
jgi:pyrroloquinoline-quinone synthase